MGLAALLLGAARPPIEPRNLYVVSKGEPRLFKIDLAKGKVVASVETGVKAHELVRDGDQLFVPIYSDGIVGQPGTAGRHVEVYRSSDLKRLRTVDLGQGVRPHSGVLHGDTLWLTAEMAQAVWGIHRRTGKVVARIATGAPESHGLAVDPSGRFAITANVGAGSVSFLDLRRGRLLSVLPVARRVQRVTFAADGRWAVTHDVDSPRLAVLDPARRSIARWVPLPERSYGSVLLPGGKHLLLASPWSKRMMLVDTASWQVVGNEEVGCGPTNLVVTSDGRTAYGSCPSGGSVVEVALPSLERRRSIPVAKGIEGLSL